MVGHSLGAAFALRLVERAAKLFEGLLLASAFVGALGLPDYDTIKQLLLLHVLRLDRHS